MTLTAERSHTLITTLSEYFAEHGSKKFFKDIFHFPKLVSLKLTATSISESPILQEDVAFADTFMWIANNLQTGMELPETNSIEDFKTCIVNLAAEGTTIFNGLFMDCSYATLPSDGSIYRIKTMGDGVIGIGGYAFSSDNSVEGHFLMDKIINVHNLFTPKALASSLKATIKGANGWITHLVKALIQALEHIHKKYIKDFNAPGSVYTIKFDYDNGGTNAETLKTVSFSIEEPDANNVIMIHLKGVC